MIPSISTNTPLASIIPVCEVIIVGIIFELVADLRRGANDKKFNKYKLSKVYRSGKQLVEKEINAEDLKAGDIIKMQSDT